MGITILVQSQVWWCTPLIPVPTSMLVHTRNSITHRAVRQEDEFKVSLAHLVRFSSQNEKKARHGGAHLKYQH